jgi:hypothetical protein
LSQFSIDRNLAEKIARASCPENCQHWYGYLSQKDRSDPIPQDCIECGKVIECMVNKLYSAPAAAKIKGWYTSG